MQWKKWILIYKRVFRHHFDTWEQSQSGYSEFRVLSKWISILDDIIWYQDTYHFDPILIQEMHFDTHFNTLVRYWNHQPQTLQRSNEFRSLLKWISTPFWYKRWISIPILIQWWYLNFPVKAFQRYKKFEGLSKWISIHCCWKRERENLNSHSYD